MIQIDSLETIKKKLGIEDGGLGQRYLVNTCYRYMDKYVPKNLGLLRDVVYMDSNSITYMSPYASYQYYGMRKDRTHKVKNYTTPGTGPYWDQRMLSADSEKVIREVSNYIKRRR